jgi:dipeptidyl-peptidase III
MRYDRLLGVMLITATAGGCYRPEPAATESAAPERTYLLERIDDAAVVQIYADGFRSLPLREKTLIWHLYQAAIAGRDIFYDQRHRHALEMRRVLETVIRHPQGIDGATLDEIRRYTKLFWLNTGPYNNHTARKFVLAIAPQTFAAAVKTAVGNGATSPAAGGESLDAMLTRLQPMFFDPNVDPIITNRNPGPGRDILTASASNLYAGGVTAADLKGFTEKYGLNSRLVKRDGRLIEEVYRVGGRYSQEWPMSRGLTPRNETL